MVDKEHRCIASTESFVVHTGSWLMRREPARGDASDGRSRSIGRTPALAAEKSECVTPLRSLRCAAMRCASARASSCPPVHEHMDRLDSTFVDLGDVGAGHRNHQQSGRPCRHRVAGGRCPRRAPRCCGRRTPPSVRGARAGHLGGRRPPPISDGRATPTGHWPRARRSATAHSRSSAAPGFQRPALLRALTAGEELNFHASATPTALSSGVRGAPGPVLAVLTARLCRWGRDRTRPALWIHRPPGRTVAAWWISTHSPSSQRWSRPAASRVPRVRSACRNRR